MEEPDFKFTLRTEGPMYQNPMPTEKIQAQLDETRAELTRVRSLLAQALEVRCPDSNCRNCSRWNAWYLKWGSDWYRCPECGAAPRKPCWDKRAPQGQRVRSRPHDRRKAALDPLPDAP